MSIRLRILEKIEENNTDKAKLSRIVNVSKSTMNAYLSENGSIPSAEIIGKIAKALNTTTDYLIFGEESSKYLTNNESELLHYFKQLSDREQIMQIGELRKVVKDYKANKNNIIKEGKLSM